MFGLFGRKKPKPVERRARVAGVSFQNYDGEDRQTLIKRLRPGDEVAFVRERSNPEDPEAVAVASREGQIGYVPADCVWLKIAVRKKQVLKAHIEEIGRPGPKKPLGVLLRIQLAAPDDGM